MEAAGEAVLVAIDRAGQMSRSFSTLVDGRLLRFTALGATKMKDNATGSVWSAITGECESGEMQGRRLAVRADGRTMVRPRRNPDTERLAS
jgi:hypothetical protein